LLSARADEIGCPPQKLRSLRNALTSLLLCRVARSHLHTGGSNTAGVVAKPRARSRDSRPISGRYERTAHYRRLALCEQVPPAGCITSACLRRHVIEGANLYQPCIPTRGNEVPAGPDWFHEIKHDGYRLIVQMKASAYGCSRGAAMIGRTVTR
jgi:hypothetical protein